MWTPLGEDRIFDIGDVSLEARFLPGVEFPVQVPGSALAGAGLSLLLHLGFVPHGDVLTIFCNNF